MIVGSANAAAFRRRHHRPDLTRELINDLPLVNRNPFDLAFLAPGVLRRPAARMATVSARLDSSPTSFPTEPQRAGDLLLDGVSVMNSDNNPGVQKALYVPPVEAIQEFKIQQANFSAEFGNSGGTIVNVVTRSGTNQYHGELYEFLRNNDLNANTFFANAAGLAQPHLTRNDFGVTAGGPIFKNKTFFFFDFNGIRALTGARLAGVPDAAERTGNFGELCARAGGTFNSGGVCSNPAGQIYDPYTSQPNAQNNATGRAPIPFDNLATYISPGNPNIPFGLGNLPSKPGNLIDPVGAKLIQAFPLPNLNVGTSAYDPYHNWVATASSPFNQQSFDIKLDQHFSDKNIANVRFSHEWDAGENPNFFGSVYDTNTQGPTKHSALVGDINYVHTFSAATSRASPWDTPTTGTHRWRRGILRRLRSGERSGDAVLHRHVRLSDATFDLALQRVWLQRIQWLPRGPVLFHPSVRERDRALGGIRGSRHGKARDQGRWRNPAAPYQFPAGRSPNGLFAFTNSGTASGTAGVGGDALAGLMIGYVDNAFTEYEIPPFTSTQNYQIGGFIQDNWRVTCKLTLNLGFRYDVETRAPSATTR